MHDVLKLIGNVLQRYAKYKIAVAVNLILFTLILFLSIDWRLAPLRIEGINDTRLIHYTSHIIFIPLLCLYLPLKLLKKRYQSAKKAYLVGLLLSLMTGCVSASYTHLISEPGSFLFKIEGGVINTDDPRYDPNDPNDSYFTIMISTGVDGYETPMRDEYFFVEAFLHSLFYCFYMLCFLQAYGIFHKRELKQKLKQQQKPKLKQKPKHRSHRRTLLTKHSHHNLPAKRTYSPNLFGRAYWWLRDEPSSGDDGCMSDRG